jgi:hypothetical protein
VDLGYIININFFKILEIMGIDITGIFSESFWYVAPIIVSITMALTQAINTKFNIQGWYQQLVSWIVAAALAAGAWGLNFVSLGTPTWLSLIAFMAVCGLSSNGVYDVPAIKALIEKWFSIGKLLKKE